MKNAFSAAITAALLLSQFSVSAMHPAARKALALGAGTAVVATVKHFKNTHALKQIETVQKNTPIFFSIATPTVIVATVGVCGALAYGGYYVWHTTKLHTQAREFCLKRLEETKNALGTWQQDNGNQAKECLRIIVRLFLDQYSREDILKHYGKQHLEPYIVAIPSHSPYQATIAQYSETTAPITDQENANLLSAYCDDCIRHVSAQ